MKRNKIFSTVAGLALIIAATGCSDFTDLQPKGKNLLSTTEQLEMLLNTDQGYYSGVSSSGRDMRIMSGDIIYALSNVFTDLAQPNKTRKTIMWTWDESMQDRMAELSNDDEQYAGYYGIIGRICNPILSRIDEAEGPDNVKAQLKAEALALRAYYHFLLVNKYCKGYSAANGSKPGIIYMTEDVDIQVPQEKKTLQECYDLMLKDIDEAIALNALIGRGSNPMRIGQAGAYAIKALIHQNMQQWGEAEAAAKQSIELYGTIANYWDASYTGATTGFILGGSYPVINRGNTGCEEDLYFPAYNTDLFNSYNPEIWDAMETGHVFHDRLSVADMMYDYLMPVGPSMTGLNWQISYDLNSYWNEYGIRTSQMYLVVAEAELHNHNVNAAMEYVDKVRENRIKADLYQPLKGTVTDEADAIAHYKQTARAEEVFTIYGFINYKRWNQVTGWEQTLVRDFGQGQRFTLSPNSPMWIFPFPMNVVSSNPNLTQNYLEN